MTVFEFYAKSFGKKRDFDGAFGCQCVDLARFFVKEVLNLPQFESCPSAKDLWLEFRNKKTARENFEQVTKDFETNDILVWDGTPSNPDGHVAIFVARDGADGRLLVFEQNGLTQEGGEFKMRSAENLLGGLRKKRGEYV